MYKKLREISSTTPISQLPEILTHNNNIITEEFDYFYDSSTGRLTRSVYVPQGKVQAYTGEFRTLMVDSITINNPATLINNVIKQAYDIPHNAFASNFSSDTLEKAYEDVNRTQTELICHDASVVAIPPFKNMKEGLGINQDSAVVSDTITLYNTVEAIANKFISVDASLNEFAERIEDLSVWGADDGGITYPDDPDSFKNKPTEEQLTYPKSYMYATIVQLKRQGVSPLHINDLKANGANVHTYYPVMNPMKVSNTNYIAIECWGVGRVIDIKFEVDPNKQKEPFMFLMNRFNENGKREYLQVKWVKGLTCLRLKCTGYSDTYGTIWEIYSWSGSPENFTLVEL